MALPYFFAANIESGAKEFVLDEETSKHIVQVLRMQTGEALQITDGKGNLFSAVIVDNNKKRCVVAIESAGFQPPSPHKITIAISLVKNAHRFEWFLEKATEIGVNEIVPLICSRTEKQHFRMDRMKGILVSAMLQSQQSWLPELHEPQKASSYIRHISGGSSRHYIAHCSNETPRQALNSVKLEEDAIILIGPEGDFTIDEIELALQHNFVPVTLGDTRLRTETAGMVASVILTLPAHSTA